MRVTPHARPSLTLASGSFGSASKAQLQELYEAETGNAMPSGFTKQQLQHALNQLRQQRSTGATCTVVAHELALAVGGVCHQNGATLLQPHSSTLGWRAY